MKSNLFQSKGGFKPYHLHEIRLLYTENTQDAFIQQYIRRQTARLPPRRRASVAHGGKNLLKPPPNPTRALARWFATKLLAYVFGNTTSVGTVPPRVSRSPTNNHAERNVTFRKSAGGQGHALNT